MISMVILGVDAIFITIATNQMLISIHLDIDNSKSLLARLYESKGRAIAVTPASGSALASVSALASALLEMLVFD